MKSHKMDRYLVSKQPWELSYIERKFSCKKDLVLAAIKEVGHSRQRVYRYLRVHIIMDILKEKEPLFYKEMKLVVDRDPDLNRETDKTLRQIAKKYITF